MSPASRGAQFKQKQRIVNLGGLGKSNLHQVNEANLRPVCHGKSKLKPVHTTLSSEREKPRMKFPTCFAACPPEQVDSKSGTGSLSRSVETFCQSVKQECVCNIKQDCEAID